MERATAASEHQGAGDGRNSPVKGRDDMAPSVGSRTAAPSSGWLLRWLGRLGNGLALVLQVAVFIGFGFWGAFFLERSILNSGLAPLAFWLWMLLGIPGVALHEAGHYLAAKWKGMCVVRVQVMCLEIIPRRRGVRMRWHRMPKGSGMSGFVQAFGDPSAADKAAHVAMIAGGPAINLLAAALLVMIGVLLPEGPVAGILYAFALMNVTLGVQNLIPRRGRVGSDGYKLVLLLAKRGSTETHPYVRLIEYSLFGTTSDQLPQQDLDALEEQDFPMPLVALWYRVKALQIQGAWALAASMRERLKQMREACNPSQRQALRELFETLSVEIAFSEAMSSRNAVHLPNERELESELWTSPHLELRCQALRAALAGDGAACARLLQESETIAENDVDASLRRSERVLRGYTMECLAAGNRREQMQPLSSFLG